MDIKTKPFALDKKLYTKLCHKRFFKKYRWIGLGILLSTVIISFFTKWYWLNWLSVIGILCFYAFWAFAFYSMTKIPQSQMLFDKYFYTINDKTIAAMIDARKGMCIPWDKIKNFQLWKDGIILELTFSHIIYLPYKIFRNDLDITFLKTLLKKKLQKLK